MDETKMNPQSLNFENFKLSLFHNRQKYSFTFAMIKPQAVEDLKTGRIIQMIEDNGFGIVQIQKCKLSIEYAKKLYQEHCEKDFFNDLCEFIISGDVVLLCLFLPKDQGECWKEFRKLMTKEDGIRAQFGISQRQNAIHGSDSLENAKRELRLFLQSNNSCSRCNFQKLTFY